MIQNDSHARSIAKAVTWRVLGTLTTSALVFVFTRRLGLSVTVGVLEFASKIGLFWFHERVWDRLRIGRKTTRPAVVWFTGLSGSGKSTIAAEVVEALVRRGAEVEHLDGDTIREIFPQTGFTREERDAHVRRVGYLASRLERHGVTVVASLISPYEESRAFVRGLCDNFIEVYVATPVEECERRDPKGLYAKVRRGEITGFTGIDDPYEAPGNAEVVIDTQALSTQDGAALVLQSLQNSKRSRNGAVNRSRGPQRLHPQGSLRELQAAGDAVVDRKG
ncbi:MAG: adenylyl-sulfate kinase [Gemmatimonadales bacterium]